MANFYKDIRKDFFASVILATKIKLISTKKEDLSLIVFIN